LELITPIADHEKQHVAAVTSALKSLGATPVTKPKIAYPKGTFDTKQNFLKTASMFEELGVKAYHGQVPLIKSADILAAGASIAGVESRHAAILASLIDGQPFPAPVEAHLSMNEVLAAVKPLIS
jgi:rubrerythrin